MRKMLGLRRIRMKDIAMMLAASIILVPVFTFADRNLLAAVLITLFILSMLAIFSRRASAPLVSIILAGILGIILLPFFGMTENFSIICIFIIMGLVFELIALISKETESGILIASAISSLSFPFIAYFVMGVSVRENYITLTLKGVDYLIVGICSALLALLIWYCARNSRSVLRFVYSR